MDERFRLEYADSTTAMFDRLPANFKNIATTPRTHYELFQDYLLLAAPRCGAYVIDLQTFNVEHAEQLVEPSLLTAAIKGSYALKVKTVAMVTSMCISTHVFTDNPNAISSLTSSTTLAARVSSIHRKFGVRAPPGYRFARSMVFAHGEAFFVTARNIRTGKFSVFSAACHKEAHAHLRLVDGLCDMNTQPLLKMADDNMTLVCLEENNVRVHSSLYRFNATLPFTPESFASLSKGYFSFYNQNLVKTFRVANGDLEHYMTNEIVDTCIRSCTSYRGRLMLVGTLTKTCALFEALNAQTNTDSLQSLCLRVLLDDDCFKNARRQVRSPCLETRYFVKMPACALEDDYDMHWVSCNGDNDARPIVEDVLPDAGVATNVVTITSNDNDELEDGELVLPPPVASAPPTEEPFVNGVILLEFPLLPVDSVAAPLPTAEVVEQQTTTMLDSVASPAPEPLIEGPSFLEALNAEDDELFPRVSVVPIDPTDTDDNIYGNTVMFPVVCKPVEPQTPSIVTDDAAYNEYDEDPARLWKSTPADAILQVLFPVAE